MYDLVEMEEIVLAQRIRGRLGIASNGG